MQPATPSQNFRDPHPHGPTATAKFAEQGGSRPHGKGLARDSPMRKPTRKNATRIDLKSILGYVKAMHKRLFKASWRVKTALSLVNAERRKNAEDAPAGSEDKESDLEYYEHPFSSDEDEEEDVESAYQGDE